jgi:hypothetical protein
MPFRVVLKEYLLIISVLISLGSILPIPIILILSFFPPVLGSSPVACLCHFYLLDAQFEPCLPERREAGRLKEVTQLYNTTRIRIPKIWSTPQTSNRYCWKLSFSMRPASWSVDNSGYITICLHDAWSSSQSYIYIYIYISFQFALRDNDAQLHTSKHWTDQSMVIPTTDVVWTSRKKIRRE